MDNQEYIMSIKEVSNFLEVHENTVRNWIKEGRLRAEKNEKSYKINRSDVFKIYMAKSKVDRSKENLISTQHVKEEINIILNRKCRILFSMMEKILNQQEEYMSKLEEDIKRIEERNNNLTLKTHDERKEIANSELREKIKLMNKYDNDILEILLDFRKDIESFYNTVDLMKNLNQFYKYIESNKSTLDEELDHQRKILNKIETNYDPKISIKDLFK